MLTTNKIMIALSTFSPRYVFSFLSVGGFSYLRQIGWYRSFWAKKPVDTDGNPLPWVTYPFIHFLTDRLNRRLDVFEFGAGHSTIYFAQRAGRVVSVEHDPTWHDEIKKRVPGNAKVVFCELDENGAYCRAAKNSRQRYHIIMVDGRDRVHSVMQSASALKGDGVLILDDSERPEYTEASRFLKKKGWRRLDFWGMGVGLGYLKCTTLFYRSRNCLGI